MEIEKYESLKSHFSSIANLSLTESLYANQFEIYLYDEKAFSPYQVISEKVTGWEIYKETLTLKFSVEPGKLAEVLDLTERTTKVEIKFHSRTGEVTDSLVLKVKEGGFSMSGDYKSEGIMGLNILYKIESF